MREIFWFRDNLIILNVPKRLSPYFPNFHWNTVGRKGKTSVHPIPSRVVQGFPPAFSINGTKKPPKQPEAKQPSVDASEIPRIYNHLESWKTRRLK